ncbi:unnamed protein product [Dibothriocephalus latus]|uniref:Uncharacterized protein n=1 Tax=Dibothriocephalus latus TaxID=60516 RepID=A0A3P7NH73_DIBLA|nr:unnamed protein product [Dibothriocephalus latus]
MYSTLVSTFQEETQELVDIASITLREVEVDLKSWEDIMLRDRVPEKSVKNIAAIWKNLLKVKADVEQIMEALKNSGTPSSPSGVQGPRFFRSRARGHFTQPVSIFSK